MASYWELALNKERDNNGERLTRIFMPAEARVTGVLWIAGTDMVMLYAVADDAANCVERHFQLLESREAIDCSRYSDHIGTIQSPDGKIVYHVAERKVVVIAQAAQQGAE